MTDPLNIRPYTHDDYGDIASIVNQFDSATDVTPQTLSYQDEARSAHCKFNRWVAEYQGRVVGFCYYTQFADMYEPEVVWIGVKASPTYNQLNVRHMLEAFLVKRLSEADIKAVRFEVSESDKEGRAFAEENGFAEFGRRWEYRLDAQTFDWTPFAYFRLDMQREDIEILSLAELESDSNRDQKLYALQTELDQAVPLLVTPTPMTFSEFHNQILANPTLLHDGLFIATHAGEYVGMTSLFRRNQTTLAIDLTGTRRPYQGKGIATALKLRGIEYAQRENYQYIVTQNDTTNRRMVAINERLGYVRMPGWIQYVKWL